MPKQTIEIEAPEGCGYDCYQEFDDDGNLAKITVHFKKKDPEFIEVRDFLCRNSFGVLYQDSLTKGFGSEAKVESLRCFVKWLTPWRKVYI